MLSLLTFGSSVPARSIPLDLNRCLFDLADSGLCRVDGGKLCLPGLALTPVDGILYFHDIPTGRQTLYFGTDSLALSTRLQLPVRCDGLRVLDACAGPGLQGLLSAIRGAVVTAVEVNPVAVALCQCNAAINGVADRISVVRQDIAAFLRGTTDKYNYIFANPPLLPIPPGYGYPFVGDGGADGLALTRRIIELGVQVLDKGGRITCIGISGGSWVNPKITSMASNLSAEAGMSGNLILLAVDGTDPDSAWVSSMVDSVGLYTDGQVPSAIELSDSYRKMGCEAVYSYALSVIDDGNSDWRQVDLCSPSSLGLSWWF
ncbi:methyltransferase [Actinomyces respiraculi]|uniref:methyltransferase n=1 Tax=Actinomyces respiraculi TaxID=2744574 RepID=UPI001F2F1665|nr:class I SAM-dependent methyltransferase [Actinomyces respiraculi]